MALYSYHIKKLEANSDNKSQAILFGRWILKHAESTVEGQFFCWKYNNKTYDTAELYEEYLKNPLGVL